MAFGMSNPVLNDKRFQPDDPAQAGWAAGQAGPGLAGAPPATPPKTMTVGGTIAATAVLWILLLASGAWSFSMVETTPNPAYDEVLNPNVAEFFVDYPSWIPLLGFVGLGLALVIAFVPKMARFLSPLYALAYGVLLGWISALYEAQFSGIVLQAVGATLGVFGVMLFLYGTRIIKVTKRFAMIVMGATLGIAAFYLVALLASFFGADLYFMNEPSPLGIAVSVGIAFVAALNLALDFAFIENASKQGMPKYMEWYGAFGITVTIVWLYLELLRLLALLRQN
jgi:uncharacterized YccA/Bax inhibitor family protein